MPGQQNIKSLPLRNRKSTEV